MKGNTQKIDASDLYLAIAFLKECNFACGYCDPHGESKITHGKNIDYDEFVQIIDASFLEGFRTYRFTGGECTLAPWFQDAVNYTVNKSKDIKINICTNGSTLEKHLDLLEQHKDNVSLRISLDSIDLDKRELGIVKVLTPELDEKIHAVKDRGIYARFNTVVTQKNLDQIFKIINYASRLKMDVKLLDMYIQDQYIATHGKNGKQLNGNPDQYWSENYVDLNVLRQDLAARADEKILRYNKDGGFGIQMYAYIIDGITVIFKDSTTGAFFNKEACVNSCKLFGKTCQEGVYTPHVSSNMVMHINGCHNTTYQWDLRNKDPLTQQESFRQILILFEDLVHIQSPPINIQQYVKNAAGGN